MVFPMPPEDGGTAPLTGAAPEEVPNVLVLPAGVEPATTKDEWFGALGPPLDRRTPFYIGFTGALGVAIAYLIVRGLADITSVLIIIGVALFIAVGLSPIVDLLIGKGLPRGAAVGVVIFGFLLVAVGFGLAAIPPVTHEVHNLITNYPSYKADLASGRGWAGRLAAHLHLTGYLKNKSKLTIPTSGLLGAGKVVISIGVAFISVMALTIYFLVALPGVRSLWLSVVPRSRRERVALLSDEVFERVGGFMLGNLLTSLVAGVGTWAWLMIFGVPYSLLLALFVAIFDLIPMVGSTIAGVVVTLVALTRGLPIAIATAVFYVAYRFLEDYLLYPRVMKHTVKVSPGLTIVATLIGGSLLGIVGALVAIPLAATVRLLLEEVTVPRQNQR